MVPHQLVEAWGDWFYYGSVVTVVLFAVVHYVKFFNFLFGATLTLNDPPTAIVMSYMVGGLFAALIRVYEVLRECPDSSPVPDEDNIP